MSKFGLSRVLKNFVMNTYASTTQYFLKVMDFRGLRIVDSGCIGVHDKVFFGTFESPKLNICKLRYSSSCDLPRSW